MKNADIGEERTMKTSKLPRTDSIHELGRFWEKHDLTEFEDELEEVIEPYFPAAI